jgi:hypothetical protein
VFYEGKQGKFAGPIERGVTLQLTQGFGQTLDEPGFIQLTRGRRPALSTHPRRLVGKDDMIHIKELGPEQIGRWVDYRGAAARSKRARLSLGTIVPCSSCTAAINEWNRFSEFTAAATDPSDLTFRKTMILSHRTNAADAILRDGFRDGEGSYLLEGMTLRGVFVSDMPLDSNEEQLESSFWRSHCLPSAIFQITS